MTNLPGRPSTKHRRELVAPTAKNDYDRTTLLVLRAAVAVSVAYVAERGCRVCMLFGCCLFVSFFLSGGWG